MELSAIIDKLSFNSYEKAAILFLAQVRSASAKEIIKATKIPQGRIYSVLNSLTGKNIIAVIPSTPKQYAIDDVKRSLHLYIERSKASLAEQQEQIKDMELQPRSFPTLRTPSSVMLFTGRDEHINALISMRHEARKELLQIAPLFIGTFSSTLSLQKALERGVKVKIIIRDITKENAKTVAQALQAGAEIRKSTSPELLSMAIRDDDQYLLGVQDYRNKEERLTILGRNKALLQALRAQFSAEWKKSTPVKAVLDATSRPVLACRSAAQKQ